ncbi:hypothetical protein TorRG33x02_016340 [Trema orientale]|uniref:Uncharacterized protein n=1 Tax=Trema orientale TaxID=63057 RepID=A0A2P5FXX4_TREOI|nr:hypothetical protein TorRG33x02_016340 [Trema orientale]
MAFVISEAQPSFSEAEKTSTILSHVSRAADREPEGPRPITSQLHLKSSKSLNKDVVLRRIRHHKYLSRVRSAFQGLVSSSEEGGYVDSVDEQRWLDQNDNFSSP